MFATSRFVVNMRRSEYDVYCGRPGPWGNPFFIGPDGGREAVIQKYEDMVRADPEKVKLIKQVLKGKILGCYCRPLPCHADVLARIANEEEEG